MATGRDNQLTKQLSGYLVAAELCRRGFIATTFTGNVPQYDIIALNASARHKAIQVKAVKGRSWHFDSRAFATIRLDGKKQAFGQLDVAAILKGLAQLYRATQRSAEAEKLEACAKKFGPASYENEG